MIKLERFITKLLFAYRETLHRFYRDSYSRLLHIQRVISVNTNISPPLDDLSIKWLTRVLPQNHELKGCFFRGIAIYQGLSGIIAFCLSPRKLQGGGCIFTKMRNLSFEYFHQLRTVDDRQFDVQRRKTFYLCFRGKNAVSELILHY